ncbi:MAG: InlB B-repeat-containing protein, partial [Bacteroidales bacterium]|nr:InlB B-repeat-containing protein [Bacteroidales bacterium]
MGKAKKLTFVLLALVCVACCIWAFAACGKSKNKDEDKGTYNAGEQGVYYCPEYGDDYMLSLQGGLFTLNLGNLSDEGTYLYYTTKGTIEFEGFSGDRYTGTFADGNIILSAGENSYTFQPRTEATVTYIVNGDVYTRTVKIGETAPEIIPEAADGYYFAGWYTDSGYKTRYSFDTGVTGDLTLYAYMIKVDETAAVYTATLVNGDNVSYTETVNGAIYDLPESDDILGWWVCYEGDPAKPMHIYGEGETIYGDTTLVAVAKMNALGEAMGASVYDDEITFKVDKPPATFTVTVTSSDGGEVANFTGNRSPYPYAFSSLPGGVYTVAISATGWLTETLTYVSGALGKVSVVYAEGDFLVFSTVEGAESYRIVVTYGNA